MSEVRPAIASRRRTARPNARVDEARTKQAFAVSTVRRENVTELLNELIETARLNAGGVYTRS